MKSDLKSQLDQWSQERYIKEQKSYEVKSSHAVHGELLVILTSNVQVTVGVKSELVSLNRLFHTQENNTLEDNGAVDCYRLKRVTSKMDEEFFDQYEVVLDKLINDQFGSGFTNPGE